MIDRRLDPYYPRALATNDVLPFIESSDQDATEIDRPDAVVDFLESHCVDEPVGDEEDALLEAERPGVGDALHEEVSRIVERRQLARVRADGRAVTPTIRPNRLLGSALGAVAGLIAVVALDPIWRMISDYSALEEAAFWFVYPVDAVAFGLFIGLREVFHEPIGGPNTQVA